MDYNFIVSVMGQNAAKKLKNDNFMDGIPDDLQNVEPEDLDSLTRGSIIAGIEPLYINNCMSGVYIYLKDKDGNNKVLSMETWTDLDKDPLLEPDFTASMTDI